MNLGALYDGLADYPPGAYVEFRGAGLDGLVPAGFDSWRGRYSELTLMPRKLDYRPTVRQVREWCEKANGNVFFGWKGGEFDMDWMTTVNCDDSGEYHSDQEITAIRPLIRDGSVKAALLVVTEQAGNRCWLDEWSEEEGAFTVCKSAEPHPCEVR